MRATLYKQDRCTWCDKALALLEERGFSIEVHRLEDMSTAARMEVKERYKTMPQVWINGVHIGGHDDLVNFLNLV